jgi:hypothetical protein
MIFEQLNPVPGSLENGDRDLSAGHTGDFAGEVTGMMRSMRKFETENVTPKGEGTLHIRDGEAGVIRSDDAKRLCAHEGWTGLARFLRNPNLLNPVRTNLETKQCWNKERRSSGKQQQFRHVNLCKSGICGPFESQIQSFC